MAAHGLTTAKNLTRAGGIAAIRIGETPEQAQSRLAVLRHTSLFLLKRDHSCT
jgi:hypothetical protein